MHRSPKKFSTGLTLLPARVIYCDVDGTLVVNGHPNTHLLAWLRAQKTNGYRLFLWSARGDSHARTAVELCNCHDLFESILPKPAAVVDDTGWGWIRYTKIISGRDMG